MKSARIKERELIIKLSREKRSSYEIAGILGISQTKASFWIRRYKKSGSLENLPRSGRPTPLKEKLNDVSTTLKEIVRNPSRTRAGLSSKEVMEILHKETGNVYTIRHVQRLMHKMGFSKITPRVSHIKKDEEAQNKFRKEFKKNFIRSTWVIKS